MSRVTWNTSTDMVRRGNSKDVDAHQDIEHIKDEALPPLVPAPPYRHAAPSGPWPWMDFDKVDQVATVTTDVTVVTSPAPATPTTDVPFWPGYPQNLFGNWTPDQVERSQMLIKCSKNHSSTVYWMDVLDNGSFIPSKMGNSETTGTVTRLDEHAFWDSILQGERPGGIRVRSLFVDDLTSPVLRMLGTRYNVEPFFFTSSINWIPSRYQEAPSHGKGDHITITLPFVRTLHSNPRPSTPPKSSNNSSHQSSPTPEDTHIDTQAPFPLRDGNMLFIDLLAIHMVRDVKESTVISYHPESTWCQTSAKRLHSLMLLVGGSVYWQNIFTKTQDPTFLFITILWYALYEWDESFALLYNHVTKLEADVLREGRFDLTRDLHVLQAHLLHDKALLHNFKISVTFIENTPNPAMYSTVFTNEQREMSKKLMKQECENLLSEIDRLEKRREMLISRLKNMLYLAFATVNMEDSRQTRSLIEVTVRDSGAMRQIAYLTMVFLPASLIASVFGMNVQEINPRSLETLAHYVETTISLTLATAYVVITLQARSAFHKENSTFSERAMWPILFSKKWVLEIITVSKIWMQEKITARQRRRSEKTPEDKV